MKMSRIESISVSRRCRQWLGLFVGLACVGCSDGGGDAPDVYPVSGTVTFDGIPVAIGRIEFRADAGAGEAYSADIKDGAYSLETVPGTMKVSVIASRPVPGKFGEPAAPEEPPPPVMEMYIPAEFNTATTLTAEVTTGSNTVPFALESKK